MRTYQKCQLGLLTDLLPYCLFTGTKSRHTNVRLNGMSACRKQNVNVSVYTVKFPLSSADYTIYTPGIGTLSYTVSSALRRIQHLRTLLHL